METKEEYTVDYLSNWPELIPQVAKNCFKEWPASFIAYGLHSAEEVAEDYRVNIAKNNNNTAVGFIPIVCFTTRNDTTQHPIKIERVVCGSIVVEEKDIHTRPELTPWITSLYVSEEFRRRGVAKLLMSKAIEVGSQLGLTHLWLFTENHYGSMDFYKRCGFVEIEKMEYIGMHITIMKYTYPIATKL